MNSSGVEAKQNNTQITIQGRSETASKINLMIASALDKSSPEQVHLSNLANVNISTSQNK